MKKLMMNDKEKEVHKKILKDLMSDMDGEIAKGLEGKRVQKVSVIAKDPKAMEMGLEKAKEMVESQDESSESEESEECEPMSEPEMAMQDEESPEQIKQKIKELQLKLAKHSL